jgi:hypothetical protein
MGLSIKPTRTKQPTLQAFAEGRLEGFSDAEVLELYKKAFPTDRKTARSHRLRDRQLALLQRLESAAAVQPQPGDLMAGWFDDRTAEKFTAVGIISLD